MFVPFSCHGSLLSLNSTYSNFCILFQPSNHLYLVQFSHILVAVNSDLLFTLLGT